MTITPTTLTVTEGGEQTYTVVLDTAPAGTVTVAIALGSGATAPITVTPASPQFYFDHLVYCPNRHGDGRPG